LEYDATIANVLGIPPYSFFSIVGIVFAASLFIILLLKYDFSIPSYTRIFYASGIGLLVGAKFFGILVSFYNALAKGESISFGIITNSGIVFYGGLIGFLFVFMYICKKAHKKVEYRVIDLLVVCITLFHFWGRIGCFSGGCCYGIESTARISILYTTVIQHGTIDTTMRIPVQLIEACANLVLFTMFALFLKFDKFKCRFLDIYLVVYVTLRIILEFYRGDDYRGVWNGVSFSQAISMILLISIFTTKIVRKEHQTN